MTARREKSKPQQPQLNSQLVAANRQPTKKEGRWKEKLGNYLLDVSKYVLTGVVITSLFKNISDYVLIYLLGMITVIITLLTGLVLTNKKTEDK
mgnify:CR=1 FL=1